MEMKSEAGLAEIKPAILTGNENIEEWKHALLALLDARNLKHYIVENVPKPGDTTKATKRAWTRDRELVVGLISESISPDVRGALRLQFQSMTSSDFSDEDCDDEEEEEEEGEDDAEAEQETSMNPKRYYDAVVHAMGLRAALDASSATAGLVARFCTLDRADEASLAAYQSKVQSARRRLGEVGSPPR